MTKKRKVIKKVNYESGVENEFRLSKNERENIEHDLEKFARRFLDINFNGLPLVVDIKVDGRLSRSNGSFHYYKGGEPVVIKLGEKFIVSALADEVDGIESIVDVLSHELVHYALYMQGIPHRDGDIPFEKTLKRLNIRSSGGIAKDKRLSNKKVYDYLLVDVYEKNNETFRFRYARKTDKRFGKRKEIRIEKIKRV